MAGPRAIWSGFVGFGMVNIAVKLYNAAKDEDTKFNELHNKCGGRTGRLVVCKTCLDKQGGPLPITEADILKGVEINKGQYVQFTKEELSAIPLPAKDAITIDRFVDASEIPDHWIERTHYLGPDEKSPGVASKALALLLSGLERKNKIAVGTVCIRKKEQLVALRSYQGVVLAHVLYWPSELQVKTGGALPAVTENEQTMADALVDMLAKPFEPWIYENRYESALQQLIQAKLKGETITPAAPAVVQSADLSMLLAKSLEAAQRKAEPKAKAESKAKSKAKVA